MKYQIISPENLKCNLNVSNPFFSNYNNNVLPSCRNIHLEKSIKSTHIILANYT